MHWRQTQRRDLDHPESVGPGNSVHTVLGFENVTEVTSAFGAKGRGARHVGEEAAKEARRYLSADAPVGRHLADQLLLPLAVLGGGMFRTLTPTRHMVTNAEIIAAFLGDIIELDELGREDFLVTVRGDYSPSK